MWQRRKAAVWVFRKCPSPTNVSLAAQGQMDRGLRRVGSGGHSGCVDSVDPLGHFRLKPSRDETLTGINNLIRWGRGS